MHRFLRSLPILLLALVLARPGYAYGGGWVVVTVDSLPEGVVAGQELTIGFMARQHGQSPISGQSPKLEFTHQETGERLTIPAVDDGPTGHYLARFALPKSGAWAWHIDFWAKHPMPTLQVAPATGQSVTAPATQPVPVAATTEAGATVGWLSLTAAIAATTAFAWRRRTQLATR